MKLVNISKLASFILNVLYNRIAGIKNAIPESPIIIPEMILVYPINTGIKLTGIKNRVYSNI